MRLDFIGTTTRKGKSSAMGAPYIDIINTNDKGPDDNNASRVQDNTMNRVTISGNQDHLLEVYAHDKQILHVGNGSYYLRTADYESGSSGTEINLKTGSFKSFNGGADGALLISSIGYKNNDGGFKVNDNAPTGNGWVIYSNKNFGVDTNGKLFAASGTFSGDIIGSTIKGGSIRVPATGTAKFTVNSSGELTSTAGHIGG
jgi:hypothetical protein